MSGVSGTEDRGPDLNLAGPVADLADDRGALAWVDAGNGEGAEGDRCCEFAARVGGDGGIADEHAGAGPGGIVDEQGTVDSGRAMRVAPMVPMSMRASATSKARTSGGSQGAPQTGSPVVSETGCAR